MRGPYAPLYGSGGSADGLNVRSQYASPAGQPAGPVFQHVWPRLIVWPK